VLGNCLGDPKAQTVSEKLPLQSSNLPYGSELAQQHRKPIWKDRQMGPGVTTVRFRDSVQKGISNRGDRRFVKTTTTRDAMMLKGDDGVNGFRRL